MVDNRARIGDWESDTVHGQNAHLVTLVDRASRFTLAKRVLRKTKEAVADALLELFRNVSSVRTVTLDNGGEFADHVRVAKETGVKVFLQNPMPVGNEAPMRTPTAVSGVSGPKSSTWQPSQKKKLRTTFFC